MDTSSQPIKNYEALMFIAHAPTGYLATKLVLHRSGLHPNRNAKIELTLGMLASVFPDIDMLYFYLIDHRQHLHHSYWTHIPFWWLVFLVIGMLCGSFTRNARCRQVVQIVALNVFLHLLLDTVAGKILWFAPFSRIGIVLVEVPSRYGWWVWNYILHWTFGIEIILIIIATLAAGGTLPADR
jgi:inner membrane protein